MTISSKLQTLLSEAGVEFELIEHPLAFTAQEEAAASHVSGRQWAKTVAVLLDGRPALAVVPATRRVDLDRLRALAAAESVEVARESEFQDLYPDCDLGAMPPFGNLYGQDTYMDTSLRGAGRIAFHAGDHRTAMEISVEEFLRLAQPIEGDISAPPRERS